MGYRQRLIVGCALALSLGSATAQAQVRDEAMVTCLPSRFNAAPLERRHESCTALIERNGENPQKIAVAYAARGWIEFKRQSWPKALADFDASLALNPDLDFALVGRANTYLNSRQAERAIPDYDRLIAKHPAAPDLLIGRGDAHNNLKQYDEGISDFDRALALDPKNEEAINDRAWALTRQGKYEDAIRAYDSALSVATNLRALVLSNRCEAKALAGRIDDAISDCESAVALEPGNQTYRVVRGFAKLIGKRYADAISDYNDVLASNGKDAWALYERGVAHMNLGSVDKGRADIAAAERLQPSVRGDLAELRVVPPSSP